LYAAYTGASDINFVAFEDEDVSRDVTYLPRVARQLILEHAALGRNQIVLHAYRYLVARCDGMEKLLYEVEAAARRRNISVATLLVSGGRAGKDKFKYRYMLLSV
jgi:hypothetical protein